MWGVVKALWRQRMLGTEDEGRKESALRTAGRPLSLALLKQGWSLGHITAWYLVCQRPPLATNIYNRVLWSLHSTNIYNRVLWPPHSTSIYNRVLWPLHFACWVSDTRSGCSLSPGITCLPTRLPQGLLWVLAHLCESYSNMDTSTLCKTTPHTHILSIQYCYSQRCRSEINLSFPINGFRVSIIMESSLPTNLRQKTPLPTCFRATAYCHLRE